MRKTKKVVLVIVEGDSEEVLLYRRLRERFSQHDINIEVFRGDVFVDFNSRSQSIKARIGRVVTDFLKKRKFKKSDILAVLHITDTDGCFVHEEMISINEDLKQSLSYAESTVMVPTSERKDQIINRNNIKSSNIRIMNSVKHIVKGSIPYQLYYFSIHLEHVLFDEMNPEGQVKIRNIQTFLSKLEEEIEVYLHGFLNGEDLPYEEAYLHSWQNVMDGGSSLERKTNVSLMFDFIESQSSD